MTSPRRAVVVEQVLPAPPGRLFAVLASPAYHLQLDGSSMLRGDPDGPERLFLGARFSMAMQQGPLRYRSVNEVTEFEEDRALSWRTTGQWRGHTVVGGQWWRYRLEPVDGGTLVRHTYEWGRAMFPLLTVWLPRYPQRMARTMPQSLTRLEEVALDRA